MNYNKDFIFEMFLDDNVSTINRMIVATAKVVNENMENLYFISDTLIKEYNVHPTSLSKVLRRSPIVKTGNYYEHIVKNFSDEEYMINFKMLKSTVQELTHFLEECTKPDSSIVPLDKKVHVFLYLIMGNYSFNEVGEKFGLHKSSVSYIFHEIASLLSENRYTFINWPSLDEQHVTKVKVYSRYGFPNCVGFIDACRLKVGSKRKRNSEFQTILLQGVCNESLMFIDVFVGDINNTKKSRVFRESSLCQELKNLVEYENHILGDSEYKLKKTLIVPYANNELLTDNETKFNEIHWNTKSYIGHAFQMLLNRFSKLNHIDINKSESVKNLIYAACVLHNFVLLHEGTNELIKEETYLLNIDGVTIDSTIVKNASEKRQFLCNYINFIDNT